MMISKIAKRLEDEKELRLDFSMIKGIFVIDFLLLIIFTIIFFTFLGCFLVTSNPTAHTVTLSSEGPASETYPLSMGEYQLVNSWYRHKDRQDRFLMYNNLGNIEY